MDAADELRYKRDDKPLDRAFARALAGAAITKDDHAVTLVATLPAALADLTVHQLAQEL
jgi:hypothetical protein